MSAKSVGHSVLALLCLCFSMQVHAAICNVPGAYANIQVAVNDITCSDIVLANGNFASATVNRSLMIRGQSRSTSFIQGTMTVNNDAVLSLRQLTIQGGGSGGVLLNSKFAQLDGEDIEISFNSGNGVGFGPTASDALVTLRNCSISDNQRGILARSINMDNCTVSFNLPLGGIQVGLGGTITNSTISANENTSGTGDGGGILFDGPGGTALTIEDSTISGNYANSANAATTTADGGGIMVREGILYLRRSHVVGNVTGRYGGGLSMSDVFGGVAYIEDSVFSGNIAYGAGGGIGVLDRVEITRSLIEANKAFYNTAQNSNGLAVGGGVYVMEDALSMTDTTVRLNEARTESGVVLSVNSGGGLYINSDQPVTIARSTISENFAEVDGGGLYIGSATTMSNATVAGNRANRHGGGVYGSATPVITHGTVVENIADDDANGVGNGGGIYLNAQVGYSLVGYNLDKSAGTRHPDCSGSVVSSGYSFLRISDGCAGFDVGVGNQLGSGASPLDLKLVLPLAGNGGYTQTVALQADSPAIDAGEKGCDAVTTTDQRGFSRIAQDGNLDLGNDGNPCDIGAFELFSGCQATPLVLANITYSDDRLIEASPTLNTDGSVIIDATADVKFQAVSGIGLGNYFQVSNGGQFSALIGPISCD